MNVQHTIIAGIKEQLFFHNYLVMPGFGGFVLKSTPSYLSASGGLFIPPSKTVSFNAQLKQNDGVLATWLQGTLKCHASEAMTHLNDFADYCKGILSARRRLSLEGIGFFYLDFENNICFEPQQDANFLTSSFGLGPVSVKELAPEVVEPKKEIVFEDRTSPLPLQESEPVQNRRRYGRVIATALVTSLFISLLGLLVNNLSVKGELRSSLFSGNYKGAYVPVDYSELHLAGEGNTQPAYVADANGIANVELEGSKTISVKAVEGKNELLLSNASRSGSKQISVRGNFEIVFGCFTVLDNAKRMVNKLASKNIVAAVTGKNNKGMYVVSNGNYSTKNEAIEKLQLIKENFPNAWVKKEE